MLLGHFDGFVSLIYIAPFLPHVLILTETLLPNEHVDFVIFPWYKEAKNFTHENSLSVGVSKFCKHSFVAEVLNILFRSDLAKKFYDNKSGLPTMFTTYKVFTGHILIE